MSKKEYSKKVRFDFYQLVEDDKERDIGNLLDKIYDENSENRTLNINGSKIKIDKVKKMQLNQTQKGFDVYYFHVTKLRVDVLGYVKEEEDKINDLDLQYDEYIAEDINCLFDREDCVLMIQRNVHSLSISGLIIYLNEMYKLLNKKDQSNIEPALIMNKKVFKDALNIDNYRSVTFKTSRTIQTPFTKVGKTISNLISNIFGVYDASNLTLKVDVGRSKKKELKNHDVKNLINEQKNNNTFSKLEIRGNNDFENVEVFDLVNKRLFTYRTYNIPIDSNNKKRRLDENQVLDDIFSVYKSKLKEWVARNI